MTRAMHPGIYERLPSQTSMDAGVELEEHSQTREPSAYEPLQSSEQAHEEPDRNAGISKWSRFHRRFSGWRFGVAATAVLMTVVLIINVSLTIWASSRYKTVAGIGKLQDGSCQQTQNLSTWLHLLINVLGTAMLSGSNYCMQRLCAPTRAELDKAHGRKFWLDIGIVSLRNLRVVSKARLALCAVLALSSVPLHLLYNSAVFDQIAVYNYNVFVVQENILNGAKFELSSTGNFPYSTEEIQWLLDHRSELDRLDNEACINAYANALPTTRSDLLVISSQTDNSKNSLLRSFSFGPNQADPFSWVCNDDLNQCSASKALQAKPWVVKSAEVSYCLSLPMEEKCELQYSLSILVVVIVCNVIKATCTALVVWKLNQHTLVTIGDSISSFLQRPDKTTEQMCLASKKAVKAGMWKRDRDPGLWNPDRRYWFGAASPFRWVLTNFLCFVGIVVPVAILISGIRSIKLNGVDTSIKGLWNLGFGQVSTSTLVNVGASLSLVGNVLLANLPQFVLSLLYLSYNAIYTCQLVAKEWSYFGREPRQLRVTSPSGGQTSTWWLGLPYSYSIPLLIISVLLHWLFSRSIFLVNVKFLDYQGKDLGEGRAFEKYGQAEDITQCGYSPIASVFSIIVATILVLVGIANGFRRYDAGIPLVATCSAAISAACHPDPEEVPDLAFGHVQWGVVSHKNGVGHCALSGRDVSPPNVEDRYMGRRSLKPSVTSPS